METFLYILAWYLTGLLMIPFHIYYMTRPRGHITLDWTVSDLIFCLAFAVLGPIALLIAFFFASSSFLMQFINGDKVIFKGRVK